MEQQLTGGMIEYHKGMTAEEKDAIDKTNKNIRELVDRYEYEKLKVDGFIEIRPPTKDEDTPAIVARTKHLKKEVWVCDHYWADTELLAEWDRLVERTKKWDVKYSTLQNAVKKSKAGSVIVLSEGLFFVWFGHKDAPETSDFMHLAKKYEYKNLTYLVPITSWNQVFQRKGLTKAERAYILGISVNALTKMDEEQGYVELERTQF